MNGIERCTAVCAMKFDYGGVHIFRPPVDSICEGNGSAIEPDTLADITFRCRYNSSMNSYPNLKESKDAARAEYFDRWEAIEIFKARELAAMTDERALQIIRMLGAVQGWRERPDWSGLVTQQAIFHKRIKE
jgi:hypothetical protein